MKSIARSLTACFLVAFMFTALVSCAGSRAINSSPSDQSNHSKAAEASLQSASSQLSSNDQAASSAETESSASAESSNAAELPTEQSSISAASSSITADLLDAEAGYIDVAETFGIISSDNREDYESDASFANYRELSGGKLRKATLYRSASPIDNIYNRVPYTQRLAKHNGIRFILDLADSDEEIWGFTANNAENGIDDSFFMGLYEEGNVSCLSLTTDYEQDWFGPSLVAGLAKLTEHDGPFLIHCMVGKDRTGFACALLEALAGATYDEIESDYMITYDNYYGISKAGNPAEYDAIRIRNLDPMLRFIAKASDDADLSSIDYSEVARAYLRENGMSESQIDKLVALICK